MSDKPGYIPVLKPGVDLAYPGQAQPQADAAVQKLYQETLPVTVQITTDRGAGSGFFMDRDGTIGTAAHVVLDTREQFATTSDGSKYKLEIEKLDDVNDAAILRPVGLKPGTRPFAEMGSSKNLKDGSPVFPMGHPLGLRPAYISPGTFTGELTQNQLFHKLDPQADKDIASGIKAQTPNEVPGVEQALARPLLSGNVQIRPGDSGGPMFDASGKVVGINDMITSFKDGFFVPVEKIRDLYNDKDGKFQFTYSRVADPWVEGYKNTWMQKPLLAAAETAAAAGLGAAGYLGLASAFPRPLGFGASVFEGIRLKDDLGSLLSSTDPVDKLKYSLAGAADLTGVVSGLALLSSRYRVGGAVGLAVGIAGRAAADFIKNHLVLTDLKRKDDSMMPPMSPNLQNSLGIFGG